MHVGANIIGVVTTNKVVYKYTNTNLKKDLPGGSYLMLKSKPVVPGDIPLIDIVCKYKYWKFLSFIVTEGSGRKNMLFPIYLSNLIISIMIPFHLLLIPRSCPSFLDLSIFLRLQQNKTVRFSLGKFLGYSIRLTGTV